MLSVQGTILELGDSYAGVWRSGVTYPPGKFVLHEETLYYSLTTSTNNPPPGAGWSNLFNANTPPRITNTPSAGVDPPIRQIEPFWTGYVQRFVAGADLGGHRVVRLMDGTDGIVGYADSASPGDMGRVVGITHHAAASGATIEVVISGFMLEPSWNWTPGPVYLGSNGIMTQAMPPSGFIQIMGFAGSNMGLHVKMQQPVKRSS